MIVSPFLLPVLGALLGWLTGFVMSRLLRAAAGRKQARQRLAAGAGALAQRLVDTGSLAGHLRHPALLDELKPAIEAHVDVFLQEKLKEKVPVLSVFIGGSTLDKIKAGLLEEIDLLLPEVIGQYADRLGRQLDLRAMVQERIAALSPQDFQAQLAPALRMVAIWQQASGAIAGLLASLLFLALQG